MKASKTIAELSFVVGALVYLVGLWTSRPLLSGKGYFLGVLTTVTFDNYAYLRAEKLRQLDDFFIHVYRSVALITIGPLFIGVLNAPISAYEMVIYPIAFFVCLFGQMCLFRSAGATGSSYTFRNERNTVMDNKMPTHSPAFSIVSWVALIGGIVTYLLGLGNAEMRLNEKGYYFAALILGLFSAASYQKTVRDKYEGIPTTPIYYMTCLTVFIVSVVLLLISLWNAMLLFSEKGFYGLAFFLNLFGAIAVQKNIHGAGIDPPKETQVTQEEYNE